MEVLGFEHLFLQIQEKMNDAQTGKGILLLKSQPATKTYQKVALFQYSDFFFD